MGVLAAVLAVLTLTGSVQVWHVYLIAFGLGLVTVVDNPSRQTFVNEMVGRRTLSATPSASTPATSSRPGMLGPAVAGVLITAVGIRLGVRAQRRQLPRRRSPACC